MYIKIITVLVILFFFYVIFFHRSIPGLGRKSGRQLRDLKKAGEELMGGEEVPDSPLTRYEAQVGKAVTARVLLENVLSQDLRLQERVVHMGEKLAGASSRKQVHFRFAVLENEEPVAMSIPGGSIFITTGLVHLSGGDDNNLAAVLAHEVAHIDCRHAIKSHAKRAVTRAGFKLLTLGRGMLISRLVGNVEEMLQEGYSRDSELEADRTGVELARKAGFDPEGMARLFTELLPRQDSLSQYAYFKNHPSLGERIHALK